MNAFLSFDQFSVLCINSESFREQLYGMMNPEMEKVTVESQARFFAESFSNNKISAIKALRDWSRDQSMETIKDYELSEGKNVLSLLCAKLLIEKYLPKLST